MKFSTLALVSALALSSTFASAQNSSPGSARNGATAGAATAPTTTGAAANGTTLGESMPGTNAGVTRNPSDGAQPAGNADNSGAAPAPSSRISPGQKNEDNGG